MSSLLLFLPPTFLITRLKGIYVVTREEATEYERGMEVARQNTPAQEAVASSSQYYPSFTYGYQPGGHWY